MRGQGCQILLLIYIVRTNRATTSGFPGKGHPMHKGVRYIVNLLVFLGMAAIPSGLGGSSLGATANLSILLALATPPPESGEGKEEKRPQPSLPDPETKEVPSSRSLSSTQKSLLQQRIKKEQEIAALNARIAELENAGKQRQATISGSGGTKRGSGERPMAAPDDSHVPAPSEKRQRKFNPKHIELGSLPDGIFYTNMERIDHILSEHGYFTKVNSHERGGDKPLDTKFAEEFNSQESIIKLLSSGVNGDWEMTQKEPRRPHKKYIVFRYAFTFDKVGFFDFGGGVWHETNRVEVIVYKFSSKRPRGQFIITAYPVRPAAP